MAGRRKARPLVVHHMPSRRASVATCRPTSAYVSGTTHRPDVTCPKCLRALAKLEAPHAR